jgi:RNA polymerase primary sigma factor
MRRVLKHSGRAKPGITLRRLTPSTRLPNAVVLRSFTPEEREQLQRRLSEPVECVYHPDFRKLNGWDELGPQIPTPRLTLAGSVDPDSGEKAATEVLSAEDERALFLRFNYCRYRVLRLLYNARGTRLSGATTRELLRWDTRAQDARADIVRANTSLVLAMARRSRNSGVELSELVSEGNLALLRCVDKFDASRGFKFSTYACRAILASFSRAAAKAARQRAHFPTTYDPAMERSDYLDRKRERIELDCVEELRQILFENTADLSSVERRVLSARFSLGRESEAKAAGRKTLDQVGVLLGVSKERVRQIQNQAMDKLRACLEQRLLAAS